MTLIETVVVVLIIGVLVAILLPALGGARRAARGMQTNTQLRGIHQGMVVFSQGCKSGGEDGFFPGVSSTGLPLIDIDDNVIEAGTFGNNNDIRGYDLTRDGDLDPETMNDPDTGEGFMQYAFAELLTGDFIPAGGAEYFLNPADTVKSAFIADDPGDAGRFDMSKVSYTVLNVSADALFSEWRETINADAIVLGDRAFGNGDTFGDPDSQASSVWTDEGSGQWRGALTRNDSSTETGISHAMLDSNLNYGGLEFEDGDVLNLFAHPDGEELEMLDDDTIRKDQGVLFDQDEQGRATGI